MNLVPSVYATNQGGGAEMHELMSVGLIKEMLP